MRDYEEYLRTVFDRVDKNGDGHVLRRVSKWSQDPDFADEAGFYGSDMSRGEFAAEFCDALDWDGDRRVVWADFRDAFLQNALDEMHAGGAWTSTCAASSMASTSTPRTILR